MLVEANREAAHVRLGKIEREAVIARSAENEVRLDLDRRRNHRHGQQSY
jgi:hypothetical protein